MDRVCSICGEPIGKWNGPYVSVETLIMCHGELFWSVQGQEECVSTSPRWVKEKIYYCKTCWEKHKEEYKDVIQF